MPDTVIPYVSRNPRDLITAEDWNQMQILVKGDIKKQVDKALSELQSVPKAGDSGKLDGKTRADITKDVLDAVLQAINKRTGYMRIFRRLKINEESLIKHELKDFPVVDIYELSWFDVICSEDDIREKHKALFFLYHSSEKRLKAKGATGTDEAEIEPTGNGVFRVQFSKMLELYNIEYDDDSSLGNLETEFWQAFFNSPNEEFDDDQYCHSPWFDRCCGEKRTVEDLKRRGDWDDIWLQTRPAKVVNLKAGPSGPPLPSDVYVRQYDFDTLGVQLLSGHTFPASSGTSGGTGIPTALQSELPVMILLKV